MLGKSSSPKHLVILRVGLPIVLDVHNTHVNTMRAETTTCGRVLANNLVVIFYRPVGAFWIYMPKYVVVGFSIGNGLRHNLSYAKN